MNKKFALISLLVLTLFLLAGCSSGDSSKTITNVNESEKVIEVLSQFETAFAEDNSQMIAETISDKGLTLTVDGKKQEYTKSEFIAEVKYLADSNFLNLINSELNKTDAGYTVKGELSGSYAAYALLESPLAMKKESVNWQINKTILN